MEIWKWLTSVKEGGGRRKLEVGVIGFGFGFVIAAGADIKKWEQTPCLDWLSPGPPVRHNNLYTKLKEATSSIKVGCPSPKYTEAKVKRMLGRLEICLLSKV